MNKAVILSEAKDLRLFFAMLNIDETNRMSFDSLRSLRMTNHF
jgi:hypothetical protein